MMLAGTKKSKSECVSALVCLMRILTFEINWK